MAIEKSMDQMEDDVVNEELLAGAMDDPDEVEITIVDPEAVAIESDGEGMIFDFSEEDDDLSPEGHDDNLAEYIEEDDLRSMALELIGDFESDREARKDWAHAYVNGLDLLGMKTEPRADPWQGASGVFHPMLTEAVVRFQAQAMGELFPPSGPARTKILGELEGEVLKQAKRVEHELNYQLTEEMIEYRDELEQMLFHLPLAGSAFKKIYYDPIMERPAATFVPAEDFVAPYGASDLQTCERYTHVMRKSPIEVMKLQMEGMYLDVELPAPVADISDIQKKYDDMSGEDAVIDDDDRHTILEMHVTMNLPEQVDDPDGIPRPYVVTIDKSSATVLSIRRNWYEDDAKKIKRMHFVHYKYLPGMGFYGLGLIHLVGGLAKSATSILRQLIDAGTLSNLPAGLKAKGARITGDSTPLQPGEWRDVDVPGGSIREALFPLPYKEPSGVLYQLLGNVVDEGRRIGSVADVQVGNMNPEAPVGTTLALLERSMKVMTGVQARLHAAMKRELRLIAAVIKDFMGPEYAYDREGEYDRLSDFSARVDVVPVSDPNAATMAQRVVQYQAALQLAQQAPQLYDMGKLHRQMLEVLNIQDADDIIKLPEDIKPADPVTENMAILKQEPVKVFGYQDHEAHIRVHMAAMQDPKIQQLVGQSPFASAIMNSAAAHITEHVAMQYRVEIQKMLGVEMPDPDEALPEDIEREVSRLAAEAAGKLLQKDQAEAAQQQQQQQAKDPLTMIQRKELELKERELALKEQEAKHDALLDLEKLRLEAQKVMGNLQVQEDRVEAENKRIGAQIGARLATELDKSERSDRQKGADIGLKIAETISRDVSAQQKEDRNGPAGGPDSQNRGG